MSLTGSVYVTVVPESPYTILVAPENVFNINVAPSGSYDVTITETTYQVIGDITQVVESPYSVVATPEGVFEVTIEDENVSVIGNAPGVFAPSALFAEIATSASYALSSSFAASSSYAFWAENTNFVETASYALTSSGLLESASWAIFAVTARTASYALTSSYAVTSSYGVTSSFAGTSITASYVTGSNSDLVAISFIPQDNGVTYKEGRLYYGDTDKTLELMTDVPDTIIQIGQEMVVRARNSTGADIPNGSAVTIDGALGNRPTIKLAIAEDHSTELTSHYEMVGLATHDILNNTDGFVTVFGLVRGVNTAAYAEGDKLYLSTTSSGSWTNILPPATSDRVKVGIVVSSAIQGIILVDIGHPTHLHDITGISGSGLPNDQDIWIYDSASRVWTNGQITNILPAGTVSSSLQINTGSFSGTFVGDGSGQTGVISSSYAVTASYAETATSTDSAETASYAVTASHAIDAVSADSATSASYSVTSSYSLNAPTLPAGLVSSSAQVNTGSFTGSFIGDGSGLTGVVASGVGLEIRDDGIVRANAEVIDFTDGINATVASSTASVSLDRTGTWSGSFTGSFIGDGSGVEGVVSSSYALQALSAGVAVTSSYALNAGTADSATSATSASYAVTSSHAIDAVSADSATTAGSATSASYAVTSSYSEVSTTADSATSATSASYAVTSSHAIDAVSADTATSASYAPLPANYNTGSFTGSFVGDGSQLTGVVASGVGLEIRDDGVVRANAEILDFGDGIDATVASSTASIVLNRTGSWTGSFVGDGSGLTGVISSSYAVTSSHAIDAVSADSATTSVTASHALDALSADSATTATSASYAVTSSHAIDAVSADSAATATSASYAVTSSWSEFAATTDSVVSASYALTSSYSEVSTTADSATSATSASYSVTASHAIDAVSADSATSSSYAVTSSHAIDAVSADSATSSSYAVTSSYAVNAGAGFLGGGTTDYIPLWTAPDSLGISSLQEVGTALTASYGNVIITGSAPLFTIMTPVNTGVPRILLGEWGPGLLYGGVVEYDSSTNSMYIGTRNNSTTTTQAITIARGSSQVIFTSVQINGIYSQLSTTTEGFTVLGNHGNDPAIEIIHAGGAAMYLNFIEVAVDIFQMHYDGTPSSPGNIFYMKSNATGAGGVDTNVYAISQSGNIQFYQTASGEWFSGAFIGDGSQITGIISSSYAITASHALNAKTADTVVSASYASTSSVADSVVSASYAVSASRAESAPLPADYNTGSFTGSFKGDGSGLTGVVASGVGIEIRDDGAVQANAEVLDFGDGLDATVASSTASIALNRTGTWSGSFTGSFIGDGSELFNIVSSSYATTASYLTGFIESASYALTSSYAATGPWGFVEEPAPGGGTTVKTKPGQDKKVEITGSVDITGSLTASAYTGSFTGSFTGSASGSYSGEFIGDGSQLFNVTPGGPFYETGSYWSAKENIQITGSFLVHRNDALINGLTVGTGSGGGSNNTAFGVSALQTNNFGFGNTAIGRFALQDNDDGYYHTAVGEYALGNMTNGFYTDNTALGFEALRFFLAGSGNTALGSQAHRQLRLGSVNTIVGEYTAISMRSGSGNTAVGSQALNQLFSGSNNTVMGYRALYDLDPTVGVSGQDANDNTVLGYNTGRGIVTGSANTILGANVTGLPTSLSNTVIIADGAGNQRMYVSSSGEQLIYTGSFYHMNVPATGSAPTGSTPVGHIGSTVPMMYDTLNNMLYVYNGGTWRSSSFV